MILQMGAFKRFALSHAENKSWLENFQIGHFRALSDTLPQQRWVPIPQGFSRIFGFDSRCVRSRRRSRIEIMSRSHALLSSSLQFCENEERFRIAGKRKLANPFDLVRVKRFTTLFFVLRKIFKLDNLT